MSLQPKLRAMLLALSAAVYGALAVRAFGHDQALFADGAFFAFTAATSHPWDLFWHNFPGRVAASLITVSPAHLAGAWLSFSPFAVSNLYQAALISVPVAGMLSAWFALPREHKDLIVAPLLFHTAMGMTTFTFPTEVAVTVAAFWPLMFLLLYPRGSPAWLVAIGLAAATYAFSHEAMLLGVPALVLASWAGNGRRSGLWVVVACASAAYLVKGVGIDNPWIANSLAVNQNQFVFDLYSGLISYGALRTGIFLVMACGAAIACGQARRKEQVALVVAAVCVAALNLLCTDGFGSNLHYAARSWVAVMLLVAGSGVVMLAKRRAPVLPRVVLPFLVVALIVQVVDQTRFTDAWAEYLASGRMQSRYDFSWRWVQPYQDIMISPSLVTWPRTLAFRDDGEASVPCDLLRSSFPKPVHVGELEYRAFLYEICRRGQLLSSR